MKINRSIMLFLTGLFLIGPAACSDATTEDSPQLILWAWERSENLEFIDSKKVGIAFLAQTIVLSGEDLRLIPRRQPLKIPPATRPIAVTRIETDKRSERAIALSDTQRHEITRLILKTLELKNVSALQLDFDATVSEREFYRRLLVELRGDLPAGVGLTMTALASWCIGDTWLRDLPVDEAVPMIFDMGADDKAVREFLATGQDWAEPLCRKSYGLSVDQPLKIKFRPNRRFYLFTANSNGWKQPVIEKLDWLGAQ